MTETTTSFSLENSADESQSYLFRSCWHALCNASSDDVVKSAGEKNENDERTEFKPTNGTFPVTSSKIISDSELVSAHEGLIKELSNLGNSAIMKLL